MRTTAPTRKADCKRRVSGFSRPTPGKPEGELGYLGPHNGSEEGYDEALADYNRHRTRPKLQTSARRTKIRIWVSEADGLTDRSPTPHHIAVHKRRSGGRDATRPSNRTSLRVS